MPIYEYECQSCKHRFEILQKMADAPLETCERCSGKLVKLLSPAGLMFKGSGWYVTDYSQKMKSKEETKTGEAPKKEKEESKKEKKEESKKETGDKTPAPAAAPVASPKKPASDS